MRSPDAVQLAVDILTPLLEIPVGTKADGGAEFVKVIRTGGPRATPVSDRPQLTFEFYAGRGSRAWALAEDARQELHARAGTTFEEVNIKNVEELSGPSDLPDPAFPDHSRYTFTLSVHVRALSS